MAGPIYGTGKTPLRSQHVDLRAMLASKRLPYHGCCGIAGTIQNERL